MAFRVAKPQDLSGLIGTTARSELEIQLDHTMIDDFLRASGDAQWIHLRQATERVVPGNLILAQIPRLLQSLYVVEQYEKSILASYDNIRFKNPVFADEKLYLEATITSVRQRHAQIYVKTECHMHNSQTKALAMTASVVDVYFP
jgi:acyl dehydratase